MTEQKADNQTAERLKAVAASRVFTPAAPINEGELFAGRTEQIRKVIDAVIQRGQHAVIFGERGVGKTSMANVLSAFLEDTSRNDIIAPKVNCDSQDTYSSVWHKVFSGVQFSVAVQQAGFLGDTSTRWTSFAENLPKDFTPEIVRQALTVLIQKATVIVIIDEFDRLHRAKDNALFADTVKLLSDRDCPATVIFAGVADSIDGLIKQHQSVERALVQIPMPRMSPDELKEIVLKGLNRLKMQIEPEALRRITSLSQGLPHYTHLLALHATRAAIDAQRNVVRSNDVSESVTSAIEGAQESIARAYHKATSSAHKDSLYCQVLLACALADTDELGYFAASGVRGPMSKIMSRKYEIPAFAQHLNAFCDVTRGAVLQKTGARRRFRFRFSNPLMQPFVVMKGIAAGTIGEQVLDELG